MGWIIQTCNRGRWRAATRAEFGSEAEGRAFLGKVDEQVGQLEGVAWRLVEFEPLVELARAQYGLEFGIGGWEGHEPTNIRVEVVGPLSHACWLWRSVRPEPRGFVALVELDAGGKPWRTLFEK